ncbi:MAG: hypothetical protein ACLRZH_15515 [Ruthenibacterium lactatiformans]
MDAGRLGSKEFAYLGNSFNAMSDKLKNQFERIIGRSWPCGREDHGSAEPDQPPFSE